MTEDDNVYIISEHSGKQWGHIVSKFSSVVFGNKLLNIPEIIKWIKKNYYCK